MTVLLLGPNAETRTNPNNMIGIDKEISTNRMIKESTQPPKYPPITPNAVPTTPPRIIETPAIINDILDP